MKSFKLDNKGQSLIEIIVAMAVFAVISGAIISVTLGSFAGLVQGGEETEARALAQEALEAMRSVRDGAWNKLIHSPAQTTVSGTTWNLSDSVSELINNKYTRIITFSDVCRDSSDNIAICPAVYTDPHTKLATVVVSWAPRAGATNSVTQSGFLSNWDSRDWTQTDWSGGSGQTTLADATKYLSDDGGIYAGTVGQLTLAQASDGTWALSTGAEMSDTSDTNFNDGAYTSTTINGSGSSASVVLSQSVVWSLFTDTGNEQWNDISCMSSSSCWAVGNSGVVAQYNGTSWTKSSVPSGANINAIFAVSSTNIWVVGFAGRMWFYNGTTWSLNFDTGNENWNDITCTSASNCWAVGNSGSLARYNGTSWTESTMPSSSHIYGVYALSSSDIWAAGASGKIWHYNGSVWSFNTSTGSEQWNDVVCTSASDCWTVGNSGAVAQYNGTSWTKSTVPSSAHINAVSVVSTTNIWATGASGRIWNYNGTAWSLHIDTGNNETWNSIFMTSASNGWVVDSSGQIFRYANNYNSSGTFLSRIFDGNFTTTTWDVVSWTETIPAGGNLTIAVRTGNTATPDGAWSSWSGELTDALGSAITYTGRYFQYRLTLTRPTDAVTTVELADITISYNSPTTKHLTAVDMLSAGSGWIVGNSGVIIKYNGSSWSLESSPVSSDLFDVTMLTASDGWAVGASGKILRYNGTSWSEHTDTGNENWNAVAMITASDGWVTGSGGEISHWNGSTWDDTIASPTGNSINDIYIVSSTSVWAGGADNSREIIHYDGSTWSAHTNLSGNEAVQSIFLSTMADGWAIGDSGQIMRYNGTNWSDFQDTGVDAWRDGICVSTNDCWMVGDNGLIGRYNGSTTWNSAVPSPTLRQLNGIDMVSGSDGWAVGNNGTIIHFSRGDIYPTNGSFISSAFNMGNASPVQIVEWDEAKPVNTNIQFQIRTAPDASGVPGAWTSWFGEGGAGTYFTTAKGSFIPIDLNGNQWVQYRTELSGDGTATPVLQEVRVNYK